MIIGYIIPLLFFATLVVAIYASYAKGGLDISESDSSGDEEVDDVDDDDSRQDAIPAHDRPASDYVLQLESQLRLIEEQLHRNRIEYENRIRTLQTQIDSERSNNNQNADSLKRLEQSLQSERSSFAKLQSDIANERSQLQAERQRYAGQSQQRPAVVHQPPQQRPAVGQQPPQTNHNTPSNPPTPPNKNNNSPATATTTRPGIWPASHQAPKGRDDARGSSVPETRPILSPDPTVRTPTFTDSQPVPTPRRTANAAPGGPLNAQQSQSAPKQGENKERDETQSTLPPPLTGTSTPTARDSVLPRPSGHDTINPVSQPAPATSRATAAMTPPPPPPSNVQQPQNIPKDSGASEEPPTVANPIPADRRFVKLEELPPDETSIDVRAFSVVMTPDMCHAVEKSVGSREIANKFVVARIPNSGLANGPSKERKVKKSLIIGDNVKGKRKRYARMKIVQRGGNNPTTMVFHDFTPAVLDNINYDFAHDTVTDSRGCEWKEFAVQSVYLGNERLEKISVVELLIKPVKENNPVKQSVNKPGKKKKHK